MKGPAHLLPQLAPSIDLIASISGVPGVSVGVIHEGNVIFHHNYGYGDLSTKKPTTSDTIYPIASLTKSFTSFMYGSLVHEGVVDWSSPIQSLLPGFHSPSIEVSISATPIDLLSHRTGIPGGESMYWHGRPLLNDSDILPMFASQPVLRPFRTEWLYNNLGYAMVGLAMSARTGQSYGELFESRVAQPFGLGQTALDFKDCPSCDLAKTYIAIEDGTAVENEALLFAPNTAMLAAGGIRSSVNDLLVFYGAMLQQLTGAADSDPSLNLLNELPIITSAQTFMKGSEESLLERSYGLGWIRTQLPGTLGAMGLNPWISQMPLINISRLALYHQGNLPGATSAVYLFPETRSGVVVLSNGYGLSDAPDWIAHLIIEAIFETGSDNDYVQLARDGSDSSKTSRLRFLGEIHGMERGGIAPQTPHKALEGAYHNTAGSFFIEVFLEKDDLRIAFQGQRRDASFILHHVQGNTYTWFTSTREMAQKGRHIFPVPYYLIHFQKDSANKIIGLTWAHNGTKVGGEAFMKHGQAPSISLWSSLWGVVWIVANLGATVAVVRTYFLPVWKKKRT